MEQKFGENIIDDGEFLKLIVKKIYLPPWRPGVSVVSVRSYLYTKALDHNRGIKIYHPDWEGPCMTIPADQVIDKAFQLIGNKFESKINTDQEYKLVDFLWAPDLKSLLDG